ncbi:MAG: FIST N-terminal domain-containing protein, partial [Acidimicrobiales bacterium]|nr:FIST N-terminal domain-containing protein [Acidimicrobiales bacterium]
MGSYATVVSQHPDTAVAVAEVIGQSLERIGSQPGLAILFASGAHAGEAPRIARAVRHGLSPTVLLGCTAGGTLANRQEIEEGPSIVLFTAKIDGTRPLRLDSPRLPDDLPTGSAVVLMGDPFSFDAATLA